VMPPLQSFSSCDAERSTSAKGQQDLCLEKHVGNTSA
jgi:hypothetical protein